MKSSRKKSLVKLPSGSGDCSSNCGCHSGSGLARRDFLGKLAGSSLFLATGSSLSYAAQVSAPASNSSVDAPVKPAPLSLTEQRSTTVLQSIQNRSGIPLGGIGTGSVEILPDGSLDDWLLFNMGAWSPEQSRADGGRSEPGMDSEAMPFYLRVKPSGGPPVLRRLSVKPDQQDLYL